MMANEPDIWRLKRESLQGREKLGAVELPFLPVFAMQKGTQLKKERGKKGKGEKRGT